MEKRQTNSEEDFLVKRGGSKPKPSTPKPQGPPPPLKPQGPPPPVEQQKKSS